MKSILFIASLLISYSCFADFPSGPYIGQGNVSGAPCSRMKVLITTYSGKFRIAGLGNNQYGALVCDNFVIPQYIPIDAILSGNEISYDGQVIGSVSDDSFHVDNGCLKIDGKIQNGILNLTHIGCNGSTVSASLHLQ